MSNNPLTDLEPLCKLEDTLVRWLQLKNIAWVQDENSTRQRVYRGFENDEVAQNVDDQAIPYPEGIGSVSTEASEAAESSIIKLPCVIVSAEKADCIGPDFVGNWEVSVTVEIKSSAFDSTHRDHRSRVNDVLTLLLTDDLLTQLKEFDDDFDASKIVFGGLAKRVAGDSFVHELSLTFRHYTTRLIPEN